MSQRAQRAKTVNIRAAILSIFHDEQPPLSVRRVYYALTVRGVVPKTEAGYRQAQYQLVAMRREGVIPYGHISDNTRWQIRARTYRGMYSALEEWHDAYRRNLWAEQPAYVEVWCEKDALASVLAPITQRFGVPLWVARGFSSLSALYDAAEQIASTDKPAYIYHFGDYDPSGVLAANRIRDELRGFGADIHFQRAAVTAEQIELLSLPTRPTKDTKHRAALGWPLEEPSCELDALPTPILRDLVETCITRHIDAQEWQGALMVEREERESLAAIMGYFVPAPNNGAGGAV